MRYDMHGDNFCNHHALSPMRKSSMESTLPSAVVSPIGKPTTTTTTVTTVAVAIAIIGVLAFLAIVALALAFKRGLNRESAFKMGDGGDGGDSGDSGDRDSGRIPGYDAVIFMGGSSPDHHALIDLLVNEIYPLVHDGNFEKWYVDQLVGYDPGYDNCVHAHFKDLIRRGELSREALTQRLASGCGNE